MLTTMTVKESYDSDNLSSKTSTAIGVRAIFFGVLM